MIKSKKPSICIVVDSLGRGGAERIGVNLAIHYHSIGHDVTILAFKKEGHYLAEIPQSIEIIGLQAKRGRQRAFEVLHALKKINSDIILSTIRDTNIFVGLAAVFCKSKIIFREASTLDAFNSLSRFRRFKRQTLMRLAYFFADKVIANSDDTKRDLVKYRIVRGKKIEVIGNPVLYQDCLQKSELKIKHKWLGSSEYKTILTVGRNHKLKNQGLLINAFKKVLNKVPEARLILLGEGEERKNLESLTQSLSLEGFVDFIDFTVNPFPYYRGANLFVLTSKWEGFGNVIVEAMSVGTPVVSTNCPGGPKMILNNGEFGVLVGNNNRGEMSEAIINELNNPISSENKEKLKKRAWEFSLDNVADKYLRI